MRFRVEILFPAILALICISCEEPRTTEGLDIPQPYKVEMVGGNNQQGVVGTRAVINLSVKVLSETNKPVRNITVIFSVTRGTGFFSDSIVTTAADGVARGSFTFGGTAGDVVVKAEAFGLINSPQYFLLRSVRDLASKFQFISGKGQTSIVNSFLPNAISILTVDRHGNVVPSVPLTFTVQSGGGSTDISSAVSDSGGFASFQWKVGTVAGSQSVVITGTDTNDQQFSETVFAVATPAIPESISIVSGNFQTGIRGSNLAQLPTVISRDKYGNLSSNGYVQYKTVAGNGSVPDERLRIGGDGICKSVFRLATDTSLNLLNATLFAITGPNSVVNKNTVTFSFRGLYPLVLLSASQNGSDVILQWETTQNPDFKSYKLFRSNSPNVQTSGNPIAVINQQPTAMVTDTTTVPGSTYYYKLFLELTDGYILPGNELSIVLQ